MNWVFFSVVIAITPLNNWNLGGERRVVKFPF